MDNFVSMADSIPSILKTGKNALLNNQLFLSDGYLKSFSFKRISSTSSSVNRIVYVNYRNKTITVHFYLFNII
jgi:hypothetical protein